MGLAIALVVLVVLTVMLLSSLMYMWRGWFAGLFHDRLEWHRPDEREHFHPNDPLKFLVFAKCKYCGKRITCDSQGNWYEAPEQRTGE